MQAQINLLSEKYETQIKEAEQNGTQFIEIGKDLTNSQEEEESFIGAQVEESDRIGYRYYDKETIQKLDLTDIEIEFLVDIKNRKVIAIGGLKFEGKKYYTLDQIREVPEVGGLQREGISIGNVNYTINSSNFKINLENVQCSKYVKKYTVKYKKDTESNYTTAESNIKDANYSFNVNSAGIYNIQIIDAAGEIKNIDLKVTFSQRYDEDTKITIDGEKVLVPGGATISGIDEENESVDKGIVIYIVPDGETVNWEDSTEVEYAQKNYDQFVWVPVKNAVLDLSSTFSTLDETGIKETVQSEIDEGRYPMAIKKDDTNYLGVLYQYTEENGAVKVEPNTYWTPLTTSKHREPAYLTNSSYADASSNNNVGITENSLQEEYNTMVKKVSTNKGFWVGRYETSNMVSDNTQDSTKKVTVIKGTTTGISSVNWYRMYAQQKSYSKLVLGNTTTATSSMIWGSQWDQIMIWMRTIKNTINTTNGQYYVTNAVGMGNYGVDETGATKTTPEVEETGNSEKYKVKNIYDLAGNVYDWSLEAYSSYYRVLRGGYYDVTDSSYTRADYRTYNVPNYSSTNFGSRATLY